MNITAKWYTFTNKEEATGYATEAATYMEDVMRKAFFKKTSYTSYVQLNYF